MTPQTLLESLLALPDHAQQLALLRDHLDLFDDQGAEWFKNQAIQYRFEDTQKALRITKFLLDAAGMNHSARCCGYGLWANAVVHSTGLGDYEQALAYYDEAIAIFGQTSDVLSVAKMQISRIWALANVNRVEEAFTAGEAAAHVFNEAGHWYALAILRMNLASIYSRIGDDARAATMEESVQQAYEALAPMDKDIESHWAIAVQNRAISLFYLGKFGEAIQSIQRAIDTHERLGNRLEAARSQQLLAMIHFMLGRYNQGLRLLNEVRSIFWSDGSLRHTARVDLYICDCLLHLRRFDAVLDKIPQLRSLFHQSHSPHEEGVAILYEASAYVGNQQLDAALHSLEEARAIFAQAQNQMWVANCDMAKAHLLLQQSRYGESMTLAERCVAIFQQQQLKARVAEANLLIAQALLRLNRQSEALSLLQDADLHTVIRDIPALAVQTHQSLGLLSSARGALEAAYDEYAVALTALDQLRGQLMIEHRITFQSDKEALYEEMVRLCLQLNRLQLALHYVERVKSRALLELIDNRIDLRIQVRHEADRPLIQQLLHLRSERDRLYRHTYNPELSNERGWLVDAQEIAQRQAILRLEKEIAELWHTLLIQNADYAQDATLHVATAPFTPPQLDKDTLLVEYFTIHDRLVIFLVTEDQIRVVELGTTLGQIKPLIERLLRHMQSVNHFPVTQLAVLEKQAQFLLHKLYQSLLAPVAETISPYAKLIIVPHAALHYLPFHALYDGNGYLIERYEISYLPNASLWQHLHKTPATGSGTLAVGCSAGGSLPYVINEAQHIAEQFGGELLVEQAATLDETRTRAEGKRLLHFATHAEYDAEQPLFSGLLLADGWLTTFDIFNLKLEADLVTLSACQTGRSVLGGGDEILGLIRAFLYAGAKSLVVSLWSVEDQATARLMENFYANLKQPISKRAALRNAQLAFCRADQTPHSTFSQPYTHPYFWASFFLIGNTERFVS